MYVYFRYNKKKQLW
ncbi:hypothetical protein M9Q43_02860 [Flavobacterium sp. HXWNR29]|nr:hypothetical protein [Flavobacterium sp. HXWNR29]MCU4188105.1 hypothetical protein [Flavobacterium sp. HXWNR29]